MTALARSTPFLLDSLPADVWHAHALADTALPVLATGEAALDAQLPGGGWPIGALVEILQAPGVHSEWRLLLPALVRSGRDGDGPVVLVGAPHRPFAPALAAQGLDPKRLLWVHAAEPAARLWAAEQALRCAEVSAVLAWLPQVRNEQLRRLHMAASEYHKLLFVMRPAAAQNEASPAALRVRLQPQAAAQPAPTQNGPQAPQSASSFGPDALQVRLLKRRGPLLEQPLQVPARSHALQLLLASSQAHALDRPAARA